MSVIVRDLGTLRARVRGWKQAGAVVGLVPTMGALHAGHLALAAAAKAGCDRVIVTIFVNPAQFNNPADLAGYPRTEAADARLLAPLQVDVIFVPEVAEVYPGGFATTVSVAGLTQGQDGAFRPGQFEGVATMVAKLFAMTGADRDYFGEMDYQQLLVVRRMARDLDLPVEVIGCATERAPDGLALSSRNGRLTVADRARAPVLHSALQAVATAIRAGQRVPVALAGGRAMILAAGFSGIDYLELCAADDLATLAAFDRPARLLAAAWLGGVRLIDNLAVE